jgi:hypothetical protein
MIKKLYLALILFYCFQLVFAQKENQNKTMDILGYIVMDSGYDFGRINPDWYDTMRPTQILDSQGNEYQNQGMYYMSVRQTTLGIKNYFVTTLGKVNTHFEFDLFGMGKDVGNIAFRLKYAYLTLGKFGAGQMNSLFTDIDMYPNIVEFMGPNAVPFIRNLQFRFTPFQNDQHSFSIALEKPGATSDFGEYGKDFVYPEFLENVAFRFPLPDCTAEYRYTDKWGYVELSTILRSIRWEDNNNDQYDFSDKTTGWGLSLSSKLKFSKFLFYHFGITTGAGIQNYMNDADADIGIRRQYDNKGEPIKGIAIPMLGIVNYFDIYWNTKFSSSIGYSILQNKTTNSQLATAYKSGQYASINLLYSPIKHLVIGTELLWGKRQNNDFDGDPLLQLAAIKGNSGTDTKLQFSVRYFFSNSFFK